LPAAGDDLIMDGLNGILVPVGDAQALANALSMLIKNVGMRTKMGKASQVAASAYDRENVAQQHIQFFKKVMGKQVECK